MSLGDDNGDHELFLPLIKQENACLPLSINVVARYWDIELPIAEAARTAKERYPGFGGSIMIEGIETAERHGLACRIAYSSLNELKAVINAGIPPIVILPGIPEITQHASVITGYDEKDGTVFHYVQKSTNQGEQQEGAIPQNVFDAEWSEEGRLIIIIAPPETLRAVTLGTSCNESNRLCFASERHIIIKEHSKALESLMQAVKLCPDSPMAWSMLGSLQNTQNSAECITSYQRCLKTNPKSYLAYNGLGNHYLKTGQFEKAEDSYTSAIGINPRRSAKIYKNRAYIHEKRAQNSEAKNDLARYLKYLPDAPDREIIEQAIRDL